MKKEVQTSTINMTVLNDDGFLSPYSETSTPMISSEVADFLENSAKGFHPKDKLLLNVYTNCVDEVEQQVYPKAIKNYFAAQLKSLEFELKRNLLSVIWFTIIGICGLTFMILYSRFGKNEVWGLYRYFCLGVFVGIGGSIVYSTQHFVAQEKTFARILPNDSQLFAVETELERKKSQVVSLRLFVFTTSLFNSCENFTISLRLFFGIMFFI